MSMKIGSDDPRYHAVLAKQFNKRYRANPDYVRLVASTEEVIAAVEDALREGRRLVVTSGGHCLEGFVSDPEMRVILDMAPMKRISYDEARSAVAIEAGVSVGEAFQALFEQWGTLIPLGEYPGIGMGGHVVGGAFGFFCRQFGLAADYLYAVEVVTVDGDGRAHSVMASREADDPNRELWWAHTGGGGGNFGIVTRYWFRSLPAAPQSVTTFKAEWNWSDIDQTSFTRLVRNHGAWGEANSGADSPNASLWTLLELHRRQFGKIILRGVSTAGDGTEQQIREQLAAIGEPAGVELAQMPWLEFVLNPFPDLFAMPPGGVSMKGNDALLRKALTGRQIEVAWDYLTRDDFDVMGGMLGFATYGGRVNTVAPDATASAHRDAIFDIAVNTGWLDPAEAERNLAWVRGFYGELLAESGGVPVPGEAYSGTLINHPNTDFADAERNTSGVPWHTLYYRDNYPRLQAVKRRWDPGNVFRHALSIR